MSQSITHNCGKNLNFSHATRKRANSCGWDIDGNNVGTSTDVLFYASGACMIKTQYFQGVCYNNPEGGFNVFNS